MVWNLESEALAVPLDLRRKVRHTVYFEERNVHTAAGRERPRTEITGRLEFSTAYPIAKRLLYRVYVM